MNGIAKLPRVRHSTRTTIDTVPVAPAQQLFQQLLASSIILAADWEELSGVAQEELGQRWAIEDLLPDLVEHGLLTEYQAGRVDAGTMSGLILGNYRVLDRLGAGAMGVVFKAEHLEMRRQVAIKVLSQSAGQDSRLLRRFGAEMRAVAQLQHPNIVAALDAGKCPGQGGDPRVLHYLVMEYVPGQDLEELVQARGPLSTAKACDVGYQIAAALAEAHQQNLVHRDIKPSNVRLTPNGQAKLLDFGLARCLFNHLTEPGVLLGTMDYMAPEQVRDAASVDIRADIYGLGGTLYWCLTGRLPFSPQANLVQEAARRLNQEPPSLRAYRPEIPAELDHVIARMMALNTQDRFATPQAIMQCLVPFLKQGFREHLIPPADGRFNQHLLAVNQELERSLNARDSDLVRARSALVLALAELVGCRDAETRGHLMRLQRFSRCLAEEAATLPAFESAIDGSFIQMLECCAPLHDIGKVGLPDHVLLKPGKLTLDERRIMQTHTTIGADTLQKVAERHGFARDFLQLSVDITRHHHERFDGQGYPDRLAGDDIPLAARIVAIADV